MKHRLGIYNQALKFKHPDEPEYFYIIQIKNDSGNISCRLEEGIVKELPFKDMLSENEAQDIPVEFIKDSASYYEPTGEIFSFDIDTVICDFLYDMKHRKADNHMHPFFMGRKFAPRIYSTLSHNEKAKLRYIEADDGWIWAICDEIYERIYLQAEPLSLDEFEYLKTKYGVHLDPEILYKSKKEYERLERLNRLQQEKGLPLFSEKKQGFSFGFAHPATLESNSINDASFLQSSEKLYRYECDTIKEIFFSVLHYCIVNGFKFTICQHCNRLFATQTLKDKYCDRYSVYPGIKHKTKCAVAVKVIKKKLRDRKKSIYNSLGQRKNGGYDSLEIRNFRDEFDEHMKAIKACAAIDNLQKLESFLYSDRFPKKGQRRGKQNG